ncbi:tRNA 4-thiouridine(8) synthase ThiI [Thermodesulfobacteriota bacterium]
MKALCVFSGGLDSMLAAELVRVQGIDVLALFFETPFFTSDKASASADSMDLPFKVIDITKRHFEIVKKPKHGYGGNMNPCIDCHSLMFRIAGEMLKEEGADFVITGEVLGQRPMSQNRESLTIVSNESGLNGLLLRPLSAKLLPATVPETEGWVDREKLMNIQGRSRKPQMALAEDLDIKEYPSPAGGCLLTDKIFSRRLKDLILSDKSAEIVDIKLLKIGRHFKISPEVKLIVGRNKKENENLRSLISDKDLLFSAMQVPGPTALLKADRNDSYLQIAAEITASYGDGRVGDYIKVLIKGENGQETLTAEVKDKALFRKYMV